MYGLPIAPYFHAPLPQDFSVAEPRSESEPEPTFDEIPF